MSMEFWEEELEEKAANGEIDIEDDRSVAAAYGDYVDSMQAMYGEDR